MLKNKLEALLFSSGRKMPLEELSKLTKSKEDDIKAALAELKMEFDDRSSSLMLVNEGDSWKLTTREQYLSMVRHIVTNTELSKTIMETLAVIAFKYPIKQADLIKIRTNKAYDHLKELQEMGYITRQKHGRTNLIKLTQKFFEYFDLPESDLKEKFQDFKSIAEAIERKESEVEQAKADHKKNLEEESKGQEAMEKGISLDEKYQDEEKINPSEKDSLETYEEDSDEVEISEEKLGDLDVVDEPSDEILDKERKRIQGLQEKEKEKIEEKQEAENKKEEVGVKVDAEMEKAIDKKVKNILHPPPEKEEDSGSEEDDGPNENVGDEKDLLEASMEEKDDDLQEKNKTD